MCATYTQAGAAVLRLNVFTIVCLLDTAQL
jgi:hypothetical protein